MEKLLTRKQAIGRREFLKTVTAGMSGVGFANLLSFGTAASLESPSKNLEETNKVIHAKVLKDQINLSQIFTAFVPLIAGQENKKVADDFLSSLPEKHYIKKIYAANEDKKDELGKALKSSFLNKFCVANQIVNGTTIIPFCMIQINSLSSRKNYLVQMLWLNPMTRQNQPKACKN